MMDDIGKSCRSLLWMLMRVECEGLISACNNLSEFLG